MTRLSRFALLALFAAGSASVDARPSARQRPIELRVDASDVARRLFHARLEIPCTAGALTLLYPKWIPGEHGPTGPLVDVAGFRIQAGATTLSWRRDELDLHAIHCEVPGLKADVLRATLRSLDSMNSRS